MLTVSFLWVGGVMLIEKKYLDIAKHEEEEIQKDLDEEYAKMTEEQKLEKKKQQEEEVKELIRRAEERMQKVKKIADSRKIMKFTYLQKAAIELAAHLQMNVKIERKDNDLWGTIEFSFDRMWILESTPREWIETWNRLVKEANSVYIETKDDMIVYQYSFDLSIEIPCI